MAFVNTLQRLSSFQTASDVVPSGFSPLKFDLLDVADSSLLSTPLALASTASFGRTLSPLALSGIAGASTSLGALVVFFVPNRSELGKADGADSEKARFLEQFESFSLSLAAAVMITVSVISIIPEALEGILESQSNGSILVENPELLLERIFAFGAGCGTYFLLSRLVSHLPEPETIVTDQQLPGGNHYDFEFHTSTDSNVSGTSATTARSGDSDEQDTRSSSSWRMAMLIFVSLLLHNAPEGVAVASSSAGNNRLGLVVTIGIMLHNIPEGLAIAVPCLVAKPDRPWLAFGLASLSGLAEPIGALLALQFLQDGSGETLHIGNLLAAVAGTMCMVSIRDLYPEALRHVPTNENAYLSPAISMGIISGISIMSATEYLLST